MARPHIVIIGGGFGGLNAAKEFEHSNVRVTLIDRQNHHLFQPLLYQVATAALAAPDVAAPIRKVLKGQKNATILMDEVVGFDLDAKVVKTASAEIEYDYLIVAAGMKTHYFGNDDWEEIAPGLKSLDDALTLRRKVLLAYEAAEREQDDTVRDEWLTFVVIGAGPTGVEMAGALAEIAQRTMARNFRNFDTRNVKVYLVEGKDSVLPVFPSERLQRSARQQLEEIGVEIKLNTMVEEITDDCVTFKGGREIRARTVVWAAGVKAEDVAGELQTDQDRAGRIEVGTDLRIKDREVVFAVGDIAACTDAEGVEVPGLAPAAIQMGQHAAMNIKRLIAGHDTLAYTYLDKGQMATIGRSKAVAKSGPLEFTGLIAWFAWLFIHVLYLIDFRNRVAVLFDWAWAYLTFQRSARVVVNRPRRLPAPEEAFEATAEEVEAASADVAAQ